MKETGWDWRERWNHLPEAMRRFASHAGPTDARVLLLGQPGSGKGYLARILHDLSPRAGGPFVPHNCGIFTDSLAEAKLFGFVKGSFTGATDSSAGLVEAAAGGTLFLDELGALPPAVQPMLLTILETGEFRRMGSTLVRRADIRVIAATNRDLGTAIEEGVFRQDLVARLSPRYELPPLRERRREIEAIADRFLQESHEETGVAWKITDAAMSMLLRHGWPGNIRELLSVLAHCRLFATDGFIHSEHVKEAIGNQQLGMKRSRNSEMARRSRPKNDKEKMRELAVALETTNGNQSEAARLLGIHRTTVHRRLKRYGGTE